MTTVLSITGRLLINECLLSGLRCVLALGLGQSLLAETPPVPAPVSAGHAAASIPLDQMRAMIGKQSSGDGLVVVSEPDGAMLRCTVQRLNGRLTTGGLSLVSTVDGAKGEPFRVTARTLGREHEEAVLPLLGKVAVAGQTGRFLRTGLTEEYSVSVDGVRQDFVIERRPEGTSPIRLEL